MKYIGMENKLPSEKDDSLKMTPKAIHSTFLASFYDRIDKLRYKYYDYTVNSSDEFEKIIQKYREDVCSAYIRLISNGEFWEFCSLKVYKEVYEERKESYFKKFFDAEELDFLEDEKNSMLALFDEPIYSRDNEGSLRELDVKLLPTILGFVNFKNMELSNKKKILFIEKKISDIKIVQFYQTENKEIKNEINSVDFNGFQTEVIELVKSLIEAKKINGVQKDIIKKFSEFFNIEINYPDKLIQDLKKRSNGSETLFLDSLKDSLYQFISK